jgi:hypothetical protein
MHRWFSKAAAGIVIGDQIAVDSKHLAVHEAQTMINQLVAHAADTGKSFYHIVDTNPYEKARR